MKSNIEMCPCGRPLHYTDATAEKVTRDLISVGGETIDIKLTSKGTTQGWKVSRHFIALHGIDGKTLPEVAAKYGFEKIPC